MPWVSGLTLKDYRNYQDSLWEFPEGKPIAIVGPNGSGKTNILEALSLFIPGRGLRKSKFHEMRKDFTDQPWVAHIKLNSREEDQLTTIGIGTSAIKSEGSDKRIIHINEKQAKSHTELSQYLSVVWVTPEMDRLFLETASFRRKFFDRLIYALDSNYLRLLTTYEHFLKERSHILKDGQINSPWLDVLEKNMAEKTLEINKKRESFICLMNEHQSPESTFPDFHIDIKESMENLSKDISFFQNSWRRLRERDAITGGSQFGPHRSDFLVSHVSKEMEAHYCSTGEQKIVLFSVVLGFLQLIQNSYKGDFEKVCLLLLDDVIAHLDFHHRMLLFNEINRIQENKKSLMSIQIFMTSTDESFFEGQDFHILTTTK